MRALKVSITVILFLVSARLAAEPFWCPPGKDTLESHSLKYEQLKAGLDAEQREIFKLDMVRRKLHDQVDQLAATQDSIAAFDRVMAAVLDPDSPRFLNTESFRFETLYANGVEKADCDITPTELQQQQPSLLAIYMAAESATLVGREMSQPELEQLARRITTNHSHYEGWLMDGLAQWPWELWVNGLAISEDIREPPPLWQWVVARPSAGIDLSYPSQESADVVPSFGLEVAGFVKYRNRSYRKHYGVSLLTTIGSEGGAGYGVAFRWNGYWAGYVFKEGDNADAVFLGLDLYRLVHDESRRNEIAQQIARELLPATP